MRNFNIFISVVIALAVVAGIFWLAGTNFSEPSDGSSLVDDITQEESRASQQAIATGVHARAGEYVTDPQGLTLYTTSRTCDGECLSVWPPYLAQEQTTEGNLSTVYREDVGGYQYTLHGEELYYYAEDSIPGDILGDGVGGVWSIARP